MESTVEGHGSTIAQARLATYWSQGIVRSNDRVAESDVPNGSLGPTVLLVGAASDEESPVAVPNNEAEGASAGIHARRVK